MDLRPHIATWNEPGTSPSVDPETGFPIATPGEIVSVPCRFHSTSNKQFTNEVNHVVLQKGRIRFDVDSQMPSVYTNVRVTDGETVIFEGPVMEVFRGQEGCRCDV